MKSIINRIVSLCLAILLVLTMLPAFAVSVPSNGIIRVNLTRLGSNRSISIKPTCDYTVKDSSIRVSSGSSATIKASGSSVTLTCGGKSTTAKTIRLNRTATGNKGIKFTTPENSNLFCGDLVLTASNSVLTILLYIDVEDYLYGVVGYEMYPSYHLNALKAQAVAARNYALLRKAGRTTKEYDVVDTSSNQVFKGLNTSSTYSNVIKAVNETAGYVLMNGSSLAECYYTDTNGGQTESTANAWGYALSYSKVKDDPYDLASNGKVKSAEIRKDASGINDQLRSALVAGVNQKLKNSGVSVQSGKTKILEIKKITPASPRFASPSRLYQKLTFRVKASATNSAGKTQTGTVDVSVSTYGALESWYGLSINSGNNETVTVTENGNSFTVSFRRFGHGIGLSQRGAQVMAKDYGKSWKDILEYYYPGTTLKKASLGSSVSASTTTTGAQATVTAAPASTGYTQSASGDVRYVSASSAVLRKSDSTGASSVTTLAYGTKVTVSATNGTWAKVTASSKTGYVLLSQLMTTSPVATSASHVITAEFYAKTTAKTTLYASNSTSSKKKATISKDKKVSVHAYNDSFAYVTVDGNNGYIRLKDLKIVAG